MLIITSKKTTANGYCSQFFHIISGSSAYLDIRSLQYAVADRDCSSYGLTDVTKSIAVDRGPEPLAGCQDCPGSGRLLARNGDQPLVMPTLKTRAKLVPKLTAD